MTRPSNPYGDPVQIALNRDRLIIRYYRTGPVTTGNNRVKLPGSWRAAVASEVADCERVAQELRNRLYAHRAAHGLAIGVPDEVRIPLSVVVPAYLDSTRDEVAEGTSVAYKSKLKMLLLDQFGGCSITDLHLLVDEILKLADSPRADGRPKS
jgi:hypothetical protein